MSKAGPMHEQGIAMQAGGSRGKKKRKQRSVCFSAVREPPEVRGGRGLTKAATNASRHKLAHMHNEVLSQVDSARGVNEEWLQSLNDKDAAAIRDGNVVVLSWRVQQDL